MADDLAYLGVVEACVKDWVGVLPVKNNPGRWLAARTYEQAVKQAGRVLRKQWEESTRERDFEAPAREARRGKW